jgi:hypothetical protein
MDESKIKIKTKSNIDNGLLVMGIPFPAKALSRGQGLELSYKNNTLPLWWDIRSCWPDGSVKWVLLHTRVPAGEKDLFLAITEHNAGVKIEKPAFKDNQINVQDVMLSIKGDNWMFKTPEGTWRLIKNEVKTDLDAPSGSVPRIILVEESPIAPLIRIKPAGNRDGFLMDQLLRIDPAGMRMIWDRRMTWNREGKYSLKGSKASLSFSKSINVKTGSIIISKPDVSDYPEGRLDLEGCSLFVEKAWQKNPFGIKWNNREIEILFYPEEVRALGVLGGTSFRHTVHICCGPGAESTAGHEVEAVINPEYICSTGAMGVIAHADHESVNGYFPGYESAFKSALDSSRLTGLDAADRENGVKAAIEDEQNQDNDYFGLQHYGDWPMPRGSYGIETRRMYSSNEYDTAYAYYQGYSIFGDWRYMQIARQSAIHMTDVDSISFNGDMRFHGYSELAEDHEYARPGKGDFGHYWTDGFWMLYFFSGDIWAKESAIGLTDYIENYFSSGDENTMRVVWASCERNLGWPLVALAGTLEATGDKRVSRCMDDIVNYIGKFTSNPDREIEEKKGTAVQPVIWWRTAMEDGCKPFMLGIVMEGLERFHRITGSRAAAGSITSIADFLIEKMWLTHQATFIYEFNAYNRGHRFLKPHSLIPLFVRGLGYAYEVSGLDKYREISEKAFHSCLWTLYDPSSGGKSVAMIGRSLGAYVAMAEWWIEKDNKSYIESLRPSSGESFEWNSGIKELLKSSNTVLKQGSPVYDGQALISMDDSYVAAGFVRPAATGAGEIELTVNLAGGTTTWLNHRSYIHMCDEEYTRSCVSIITFYTGIHVRIYDCNRRLIEAAEGYIDNVDANGKPVSKAANPVWKEGEWHTVRVEWRAPGKVTLYLDGIEADCRVLDRPVGGRFTRLHIGHKPGNWTANGKIELVRLHLKK